jgi:hypothetical protein
MSQIDDAADVALRVHERRPELSLRILAAAAEAALELALPEAERECAIERIAQQFAGGEDGTCPPARPARQG